jgi:hypothetical protein
MDLKEIIKHLKVIENDCKYGHSHINHKNFYERVKGIITLTDNLALKQIESDCKYGTSYGTKEVNCGKFYERVKGIMSISENNI